jgi:peptidoglycan/LPS O-acetylase OafA/YrhL
MGSLLIFLAFTLALALSPRTHGGIWIVGFDTAAVSADSFPGIVVSVWWLIGAVMVVPFLAWNVSQDSPRFDRFLGNLAYPLYLFHWIPRDWYYHFSLRSDPIWKQCALLGLNLLAAAAGAVIILLLLDQPLERLRARWVASRKKKLPVPFLVPMAGVVR